MFHFVSYVPVDGGVYELDGLQPGPVRIGDGDEVSVLQAAKCASSEQRSVGQLCGTLDFHNDCTPTHILTNVYTLICAGQLAGSGKIVLDIFTAHCHAPDHVDMSLGGLAKFATQVPSSVI